MTTKPMGPKIFKPLLPLYLHQITKLQNNERKMRELFIQMGIPHEKISAAISEYRKVSTDTYWAIFNDLYSFEMDQTYNKIKTPIMFVACEYEEKGIQDTLDYAPTIISHAQTGFIKGARHQLPIQKPVLFYQEFCKWFTQLSSAKYPL